MNENTDISLPGARIELLLRERLTGTCVDTESIDEIVSQVNEELLRGDIELSPANVSQEDNPEQSTEDQ